MNAYYKCLCEMARLELAPPDTMAAEDGEIERRFASLESERQYWLCELSERDQKRVWDAYQSWLKAFYKRLDSQRVRSK